MDLSAVPPQYRDRVSPDVTAANFSELNWTEIPEWVASLTTLTSLDVSDNILTQLPDSLADLKNLASLGLHGNYLTRLPGRIANLTNLTSLDLYGNHLTELPDWLANLTNLAVLNVGYNRLTEFPDWLANCTNLADLNLDYNQLTDLPHQLAGLLNGRFTLRLRDNPLREPLPALVRRGNEELAAYLRSLEDAVVHYEAKLLLVGEGNVGKSSLVAALKGEGFVEGRPTTHGIEISPIRFRHPDLGLDMTLRAWDFGGQEVYRVSHQFFFSPRALFLVVWHARQGQERDEVEGWLRRIQLRIGDTAQVMIVATHCAERLADLDYPRLERIFPKMLAGSFMIDSRTGQGVAPLRTAISAQASSLPQMGQRWNPRWTAAREAVLALAESEPQIRYEWFAAICAEHGLADDEADALAKLMHDLGLIIYYDADEGLKDVVVLNPEWLTKAISYVLEDKATADAGGVLDHARLKGIWQDRRDGYPAQYHPYFLRLMEKFDISYRLDGGKTQSLVPQLVSHQRPALPWQLGSTPRDGLRRLSLRCRLPEPVPGLIPWLTVQHHRASTGMHWRRGVFLRHPIAAYDSEALLELHRDDELALEVRAPSPDLYFNVLRDSIEDLITRRWPGLRNYRLYVPCPSVRAGRRACSGLFPLDGLLKIRETGQAQTVPCYDCGQLQEIPLLLTGFTVPKEPLTEAIKEIHNQVIEIADIAHAVRRIHRVLSAEVADCPRLFTLSPGRPRSAKRLELHREHFQLTLWCEHPGKEHAWADATYELNPPKEWFVKVAPYARLVFRTLQLVVPAAAAIDLAALPSAKRDDAQARLDVMRTIVDDLPTSALELTGRQFADRDGGPGKLTPAEGQALRAIRQIIFESDPLHAFGDMRRVQAPSGDLLWVCPVHYPEYDPGLPKLP